MTVPPSRPAEHKIGDLQILRGVSIFLVLCQHLSLPLTLIRMFPKHDFGMPFWMGVEIFFVISGYVIVASLARDRFEPLSFFLKRVFRLTPAILVLIACCALLNWFLSTRDLSDSARNLSVIGWRDFRKMVTAILGGYYSLQSRNAEVFGGMWSLAVEDQFYAALALGCLAVALVLRRRAVAVLPALVCGGATAFYLYAQYLRLDTLFGGTKVLTATYKWQYWFSWHYLLEKRFDFLALGVVLAFVDLRFRDRVRAFFAHKGPFLTPFLLLGPLVLTGMCGDPFSPTKELNGLAMPVASVCFGLLVLAAAHDLALPPSRGRVYAFWKYLGDRSYTIYLFHFPAMLVAWYVVYRFMPDYGFGTPLRYGLLQMGFALLVLVPVVELVYRGVEMPLTAVGRRLAKRVRVIPADTTPTAEPKADAIPLLERRAA